MTILPKKKSPAQRIIKRIIKYIFFTIGMSWSLIIVNYFVCYSFDLEFKNIRMYTSEICFMTIILASTNLKDLLETNISRESLIFICHIILNIINIVLSIIFIAILSYIKLSAPEIIETSIPTIKQFNFVISMYCLAAILGTCVQIGGVIKWEK